MALDNTKKDNSFKKINELASPNAMNPDTILLNQNIQNLKNKVLNSSLIKDEQIMRPLEFDERIVKEYEEKDGSVNPACSIRMSRNLLILKQNAEEGNPLSKKIWKQL